MLRKIPEERRSPLKVAS